MQRVSSARVRVKGDIAGEIGAGLLILLGVGRKDISGDSPQGRGSSVAVSMAEKIANLRIFEDADGKMNRSLLETNGQPWLFRSLSLRRRARSAQTELHRGGATGPGQRGLPTVL